MDFKQRVGFGQTGLKVSRIGLASGYGIRPCTIEKAYYFILAFSLLWRFFHVSVNAENGGLVKVMEFF